jgi:hypothetical protein
VPAKVPKALPPDRGVARNPCRCTHICISSWPRPSGEGALIGTRGQAPRLHVTLSCFSQIAATNVDIHAIGGYVRPCRSISSGLPLILRARHPVTCLPWVRAFPDRGARPFSA